MAVGGFVAQLLPNKQLISVEAKLELKFWLEI